MNTLIKTTEWQGMTLYTALRPLTVDDFTFEKVNNFPDPENNVREMVLRDMHSIGCMMVATPVDALVEDADRYFLSHYRGPAMADHPFRDTLYNFSGREYRDMTNEERLAYAKAHRTFTRFRSGDYNDFTYTTVRDFRGCRTTESRRRKVLREHLAMLKKYDAEGGDEAAKLRCVAFAQRHFDMLVRRLNDGAAKTIRGLAKGDTREWGNDAVRQVIEGSEELSSLAQRRDTIEKAISTLSALSGDMWRQLDSAVRAELNARATADMPEEFRAMIEEAKS